MRITNPVANTPCLVFPICHLKALLPYHCKNVPPTLATQTQNWEGGYMDMSRGSNSWCVTFSGSCAEARCSILLAFPTVTYYWFRLIHRPGPDLPARNWVTYFASPFLRLNLGVISKTDLIVLHLFSRNLQVICRGWKNQAKQNNTNKTNKQKLGEGFCRKMLL